MTMSLNDRPPEGWDVKPENEENPANASSIPDLKKKRSWKKPKDKPMRPLSAYNMFFQNQRERIVAGKTGDPTPEEIQESVMKMLTSKTRGPKRRQDRVSHGQISFGDLARTIAAKWKAIDPKLKAIYNHYAAQEKVRYKKEVVIWKEKKEREHDAARAAKQRNLLTSSSSYNDSMMSMSSSATSMSTSMSTSYNLSESYNSIQGGLGMQSPDADVVQRQQDILRQQMGFIDSKPQARMDGNDNVSRELPKQELNGNGNELQGVNFPRSVGGNGIGNGMNMNMNINMNMNMNRNDNLSRNGSLLDANFQMQHVNQKEHLLLQLQHQQLQQLQQLQQARNETSRLSNMRTTDTFMSMQPSRMTGTSGLSQHGNSKGSNRKHLLEQFQELENITQELDRLKEQERQMQQRIQEHQNQSNAFGQDNSSFENSDPQSMSSGNYNTYTSNLNDVGTFEMEERQRAVRRSKSGDTNLLRGRSNPLNGSAGGDDQRRRHSVFGDGANVNNDIRSVTSSFNYGGGGQQHNQSRRDSLAALLHLDDMGGMGQQQRQLLLQQQQQQLSQSQQGSLAGMLQMQDNGGNQDLGSMFNANLGGGT